MCSIEDDEERHAAPGVTSDFGILSLEDEWQRTQVGDAHGGAAHQEPATLASDTAAPAASHVEKLCAQRACVRCGLPPAVRLRDRDVFCRKCFTESFVHRFRAQLGKTRAIKPSDSVMLALSGGPASSALVRLFVDSYVRDCATVLGDDSAGGMRARGERRIRNKRTVIVHIDESVVLGLSSAEQDAVRCHMDSVAAECGVAVPIRIVDICEAFAGGDGSVRPLSVESAASSDSADGFRIALNEGAPCISYTEHNSGDASASAVATQRLCAFLDSLSSLSAREDALRILRWQLIARVAQQEGCGVVVAGDSASVLSVRMLASIAKGRGASLSQETGFVDDRYAALSVKVIRPLRSMLAKEIAIYNRFAGVEAIAVRQWSTCALPRASIDTLTEAFVVGLQSAFKSTENTVLATADKLASERNGSANALMLRCALCSASMSVRPINAAAADRHGLSRSSSSRPCGDGTAPLSSCGDCSCDSDNAREQQQGVGLADDDASALVCRGCRTILREVKPGAHPQLPVFVAEGALAVHAELRRSVLRTEIADFLLSDDDEPEKNVL